MGFSKFAQLVVGPAGSGKTTYCRAMGQHMAMHRRTCHIVNLDPAADPPEDDRFKPSIDIIDLVSLDEVMEEMELGPNGGLIFCMEYLMDNFDWLEEQLGDYQDDYLLIDCPGQIELYSHIPVMRRLGEELKNQGYSVAVIYVLDSQFVDDPAKFLSANLLCLSTMIHLELPHVSVLSKMDLIRKNKSRSRADMEEFLHPDSDRLVEGLRAHTAEPFWQLNSNLATVLDEFNLVRYVGLDITREGSLEALMTEIDLAIQYGEDQEVQDHDFDEGDEDDDDGDAINKLEELLAGARS